MPALARLKPERPAFHTAAFLDNGSRLRGDDDVALAATSTLDAPNRSP